MSLIETEKLILALVKQYLKDHKFEGNFSAVCHFFGYEGRSCYPSYFDAIYTYHLGMGAMALVKESLSGYMVSIKNLEKSHGIKSSIELLNMLVDQELNTENKKQVVTLS